MLYSGQIITLSGSGKKVKQVNKTTARKAYDNGKTIYLQSCNMLINNMWQSPCPIKKEGDAWDRTFDQNVNEYQYYNCDAERGKYPLFFIEVEQ